jgi:hypothetical protein
VCFAGERPALRRRPDLDVRSSAATIVKSDGTLTRNCIGVSDAKTRAPSSIQASAGGQTRRSHSRDGAPMARESPRPRTTLPARAFARDSDRGDRAIDVMR